MPDRPSYVQEDEMELLLNAAQMKDCDHETICGLGIPSMVLMERAALSVVEEIENCRPDLTSVLVVCGSGNNGGDGFAVARLLHERGISVTTAFVGKEASMTEETALQKKICENCGIKISSNFMDAEYTTIVDAVFGIGLSRAIEGDYAELINWINRQSAWVVSVDIPSGVLADSGRILGTAVKADLTVTFASRKLGQILYPGALYCGMLVRRDIGIPTGRLLEGQPVVFTYSREDLQRMPQRHAYSNKGTYGKVLLIAGSRGMSGAAYLGALAAYRTGCGLVRIFTPECNRQILQTCLPEAVVTVYSEDAVPEEEMHQALAWADAVGIGPGLGTETKAGLLLEQTLRECTVPLVIDADGLNLLSARLSLLLNAKAPVILTPHPGEMARLTGRTTEEITQDVLGSASEFVQNYPVICALKDARTAVCGSGRSFLNTSGNHGMAAAGSGDVLTGIICGLLAQGMSAFDAATLGVYLHGAAGDLARSGNSASGMIARDIANAVGEVLKTRDGVPE